MILSEAVHDRHVLALDEPRVLPSCAGDLSASWVSRALAAETSGAEVVELDVTPIGTGQLAETRRLELVWDPPEAGPATIVAKVPSEDPEDFKTVSDHCPITIDL